MMTQHDARMHRELMPRLFMALVFVALLALSTYGQPVAYRTDNAVVLAPSKALTLEGLEVVERARYDIAREWLGYELRPGLAKADIQLIIEPGKDRADTWLPGENWQRMPMVWVTCETESALWPALRHEIAHVVLDTAFEGDCPRWLHEGIASQYDDPERCSVRQDALCKMVQARKLPRLSDVVGWECVESVEAYAVVESLVAYLASLGDKPTVVEFASAASNTNWERAALRCYGLSVSELEKGWYRWLSN